MEPQQLERFQLKVEELEKLVAVVAALGELVATVTAPRRSEWPLLYPESLHTDLRRFTWSLRDTLGHRGVTFLRHRGVTSLRQALATLRGTSGPIPADVRATVRAWREAMDALDESSTRLRWDAYEIYIDEIYTMFWCKNMAKATNGATNGATTTGLAGHLQDKTLPGHGTAGDSLVATAPQPSVSLSSAVAALDVPVATRQAGAATRRGQRVEEAQKLLRRLVDACEGAVSWAFDYDWRGWLTDIETTQEETYKLSPDYVKYMLDDTAEFELLCEASARLAKRHLLVTLGEIDFLLSSPCDGSGGRRGPRGRAVAEQCRKAIEDIPRLLKECDVTAVTSSGQ